MVRQAGQTVLNRTLLALPADARERVLRNADHVEFPSKHMIYRAEAAISNIYFIESGLVSLIHTMEDGRCVEIAAVGGEGLIGVLSTIYGSVRSVVDYVVQVPVKAFRIERKTLENELSNYDTSRLVIQKYLFFLAQQVVQTAACNRLHSLQQRCCHRLLVARDTAHSDTFLLTHESLALLLGVQRPSVSIIANRLQKRSLIHYIHGHVTILNRAAIEAASCECYRTIRRRSDELFGAPSEQSRMQLCRSGLSAV
jgi:CRP-like cAMP-binding protein